jgi:hypothetical protein
VNQISNAPPKPLPCLAATARVLVNLYRRLPPWRHLAGRSMFGGAGQTGQTERALRQHGWVTGFGDGIELTEAGRERAAYLTA